MRPLRVRLRDMLIPAEPLVPETVLQGSLERFACLPAGAKVCIKVSAAYQLPYPFCVSQGFVAKVVEEIHTVNPALEILLTEGGVGDACIMEIANKNGLTTIPYARFVDAEETEPLFVPNPLTHPYQADGFWLPKHWVEADAQILLTTCKLRSHHFQRWYSGGTRNLIGLLPRAHYRLSASRRNMRSMVHKQGMDAMVADLYMTAGRNLFTILDGRLLARQDEHFPLRFTRKVGAVLLAEDPREADNQMIKTLRLPFVPPYLGLISQALALQSNTV